jgi:hypothetical protein
VRLFDDSARINGAETEIVFLNYFVLKFLFLKLKSGKIIFVCLDSLDNSVSLAPETENEHQKIRPNVILHLRPSRKQ